jgi:hypothetical protein
MFVHVWCDVHLYFPNVLNACSLYLDNEQSEVPKALFVSASVCFWPPKATADCQTLSFSASFYKIRWDKNHAKST